MPYKDPEIRRVHAREGARRYRRRHPERVKERNGLPENKARRQARWKTAEAKTLADARQAKNVRHNLWVAARRRASQFGHQFSIKESDVIWPVDGLCPVFGIPMVRKTAHAPSYDRLNNSKGYLPGNVFCISRRANLIKRDATSAELRAIADWMDSHAQS